MIKVAFAGAPDSGKTTLAKMVSSHLNLKGYVPAYVHEYARDYITQFGVRPQTMAEQFYAFEMQRARENNMCSSSTQIMYTDAPLFLPLIYAQDFLHDDKDMEILKEIYPRVLVATKEYDFIYYLRPFRKTIIDDVRKQDLYRLDRLDTQIKAFLDLHNVEYTELNSDFEERIQTVEQDILRVLELDARPKAEQKALKKSALFKTK